MQSEPSLSSGNCTVLYCTVLNCTCQYVQSEPSLSSGNPHSQLSHFMVRPVVTSFQSPSCSMWLFTVHVYSTCVQWLVTVLMYCTCVQWIVTVHVFSGSSLYTLIHHYTILEKFNISESCNIWLSTVHVILNWIQYNTTCTNIWNFEKKWNLRKEITIQHLRKYFSYKTC